MTVVVTGSAGFIGRAVVAALLDAGHDVIGVDRRVEPAGGGTTGRRGGSHVRLTADLLAGDERVSAALASADAVIHLAGCPGVRDERPDAAWRRERDNVTATEAVLAAVPAGTPLVVTSSSSVYGGSVGGRPCRESDRPRPRGGYARSKLRGEQLCRERAQSGGLVAVARPFTVAGEGQRPDMALARWIAAAREGRPLRIFGSPRRTRDITDVGQVAAVLVALAEREVSGVVNVGTGVAHRLGDLVRAVAEALGTEVAAQVVPAHPDDARDTLADTTLLRRLLGFVPETDVRHVVARQVAAGAPDMPAVA